MAAPAPWIAEGGRDLADGSTDAATLRAVAARIGETLKGAVRRDEPESHELRRLLHYIAIRGTPAGDAAQQELDTIPGQPA